MFMKTFLIIFMTAIISQVYSSTLMHRSLSECEKNNNIFVWEETQLNPFDELIVSWNAERPLSGSYLIQVSLLMSEWTPWLDYALWSTNHQHTFNTCLSDVCLQVYQDTVEVLENNKSTGFRVRVIVNQNASLEGFRALHISAIDRDQHTVSVVPSEGTSVHLQFEGLSQMALSDERRGRLCSPTSTTAVTRFLLNSLDVSPIEFANSVVDSAFDIYGNWILNVAQASHVLGVSWHCFVARLTTFNQIIDQLIKGYPVVVSIKGPLKGGALPYASGHLIVVTGYDSESQEVFCMDPAFPADELTHVRYALDEFLTAWSRRKGLAYMFCHNEGT